MNDYSKKLFQIRDEMKQKLSSCPFCGKSDGLYVWYEEGYSEYDIDCDNCEVRMTNGTIEKWNKQAEKIRGK